MSSVTRMLPVGSLLAVFLFQTSAFAQPVNFVIHLHETVPMQQLADNALKYGVIYTPEQIREIAGPSDADYANLISQLKQQGFEIVSESPTHLFVSVRAETPAIENAFQTKLVEERGIRTQLTPAIIPSSLGLIDAVVGLDNHRKLQPRYKIAGQRGIRPMDGNTPGGIAPATIKTVYGFDPIYAAGFTGKGQNIAIATYDNLHVSDITDYYQKIGMTQAPSVDVVSFNGTAAYNMDSAMETELDAEFSGMMAPGASIHIFASAENSDAGEAAMFTAILDDNRAKVVNYSWGSCEPQLSPDHKTAMDSIFARAIAQGVNIMVASGDSGNQGCQDGNVAADYPASQPDVVAVGGTTLVNSGGVFETAWSGSGGGISTLYDLPSYQTGFQAPYLKRSLPDVSFNADPNSGQSAWEYVDMDGSMSATAPSWITLGGTSIAAPQWTGFLTLVNEARVSKGLPTLGFLNPIIYALNANASQYASAFHDITSGNNGYSAGTGWDAVTGWGSMKASGLFDYLTSK